MKLKFLILFLIFLVFAFYLFNISSIVFPSVTIRSELPGISFKIKKKEFYFIYAKIILKEQGTYNLLLFKTKFPRKINFAITGTPQPYGRIVRSSKVLRSFNVVFLENNGGILNIIIQADKSLLYYEGLNKVRITASNVISNLIVESLFFFQEKEKTSYFREYNKIRTFIENNKIILDSMIEVNF